MRQLISKFTRLINTAIVCSFISSFALLSCTFIGMNDISDKIIGMIFPIIFWLGLIAEQILIWKSNAIRKEIENIGGTRKFRGRPGIINIWKNRYGAIADIVCIVSLLLSVVFMIIGIGEKAIQYILIFLLVLSFRLHCILNGQNFRYKKYLEKRKVKNDI